MFLSAVFFWPTVIWFPPGRCGTLGAAVHLVEVSCPHEKSLKPMASQSRWKRLQTWQAATLFFLVSLFFALPTLAQSAEWRPIGPDGGDVRSLTYDPANPDRVYLGTSAGRLFVSTDAGASWTRFASLGGHDFVLDNMVIDPASPTIFVGACSVEDNSAGDVFRSKDGGKTWQTLKDVHGKSIRALALSASNPKVLAIGALDGVFRTMDGGDTWERLSPPNHAE